MSQPNRKTDIDHDELAIDSQMDNTLPISNSENEQFTHPIQRIGDILREGREQRGEDLHRIAEELCIRPTYLLALEGSQYHSLPADAYVIGFLRSYANYLGIDGKMAIDRYRAEMAGRRAKPTLLMPEPISANGMPTSLLIIAGVFCSFLIYGLWYAMSSGDRGTVKQPITVAESSQIPTTTQPPSAQVGKLPEGTTGNEQTSGISLSGAPADALPLANKQATSASPTAASQNTPATTTPTARIILRATQPSWILVSDNQGRTLVDRVLKTGETYAVPDQKGLRLTTGNGSGLALILDGKEVPRLSTEQSKIQRDILLDVESLRDLSLPLAD